MKRNSLLLIRSLKRLEEMLRPAAMSGLISDLLTASLASHSRSLTENSYFNGHPDLIVTGLHHCADVISRGNSSVPRRYPEKPVTEVRLTDRPARS